MGPNLKGTTMTGNRRKPARKSQTLSASASVLTLLIAAGGMIKATPALAECLPTAPGPSGVVTCDVNAPNPETDAIIAPGSTDVIVNFEANAALETATSPAIDLGGGSYIDMADGSSISDFDPATIPVVIGNVIDGDFTGIATQQDLVDLYDDIRLETPVRATPAEATIELGVPDNAALQTSIHAITAIVTVNKAVSADLAMGGFIFYEANGTGPDPFVRPPGALAPGPGSAGGSNSVFMDGGAILSGGAAAIRSPADSALTLGMTNGAAISTLTEDAPAVLLEGVGALDVWLHDSAITTSFDGSAGLSASADDSAAWLKMTGDSRIHTAGDNATAVIGPGGTACSPWKSADRTPSTASR